MALMALHIYQNWCGMRELNSPLNIGNVVLYRLTNPAKIAHYFELTLKNGAIERIRTSTVPFLRRTPPSNCATMASSFS